MLQLVGATDTLTDFNAAGATSGIGILKRTGSAVLKAEIQALRVSWFRKNYFKSKSFHIR